MRDVLFWDSPSIHPFKRILILTQVTAELRLICNVDLDFCHVSHWTSASESVASVWGCADCVRPGDRQVWLNWSQALMKCRNRVRLTKLFWQTKIRLLITWCQGTVWIFFFKVWIWFNGECSSSRRSLWWRLWFNSERWNNLLSQLLQCCFWTNFLSVPQELVQAMWIVPLTVWSLIGLLSSWIMHTWTRLKID